MKQKVFKTCVMLIAFIMLPSMTEAKKIKFGQYITYNGEVVDGMPKGKGKLIIENKNPAFKKPAIVEGTFDGWTVETLNSAYFYSYGYTPYFSGKLIFSIAGDGSSVSFTLLSGNLSTKYSNHVIKLEDNHIVTCTPGTSNLLLTSTPLSFKKRISKKESKFNYGPKYYAGQHIWYSYTTYTLGGEIVDYYEMVEEEYNLDGKPQTRIEAKINDNGYSQTDINNSYSWTFDKYGKLTEYKNNRGNYLITLENGITSFAKNGKKGIIYEYEDGSIQTYYPTIKDGDRWGFVTLENIEKEPGNKKIFFDEAAEAATKSIAGDPQGMYDLAMAFFDGSKVKPNLGVTYNQTEGERWLKKAAEKGNSKAIAYIKKKKKKRLAAIKEEEEKQRKVFESYGAHQDNGGQFFVNNMERIKEGSELACICVGLCYQYGYGINKNLQKAFEYYKKAAEASDEKVKACGNFMMGMCYWKGEGTAKNQVQAYKAWTRYSDYTSSWTKWEDITDWIGRWTNNELVQLVKPREMLAYKHYYHAQCYEQGIGTQKYLEEAIALYNASVQWADIADAWYKIGYYTEIGKWRAYFNGIPNRDYAKTCYRKAAGLGSSKAKQALNRM